ncbi:SDR family NAD(P)-dependent oxidoreductase [Pseudorhodobacter aquimaris]|uniref:SDR family NAD(P)-dependent oxidoreductase n=1 Tax=Pseudorhodobacter aquimaris TaxID=687412 RepID=UPI000A908696|nr:SDR family oxidoreductase [Pseudorhodobacter aquimaris]
MIEAAVHPQKSVMITGASRGIGLETAKSLAQPESGFSKIVMLARPSRELSDGCDHVASINPNCEVVKLEADLSDPASADYVFGVLDSQKIRLTTLVNNAGYTRPASINEAEISDFQKTMQVNVYSPFQLIQGALRHNHPLTHLINIASTAGIGGRSGWLTYSASKAAVISMSEVLREELKPYGIDVICLSPGRCATDLRKTLAPDEDPNTIMQPDEVASIIKLMISPLGQLLKSQNLVVRT